MIFEKPQGDDYSERELEGTGYFYPLRKIVRDINERLRPPVNLDYVIMITGEKGYGKTTLAYNMIKMSVKNFSFEKNFFFTPDEDVIEKRVIHENIYGWYNIDEAIQSLYKLDWNSQVSKSLTKLVTTTQRKRHMVLMGCIPFFNQLNNSFRDNLVNMWIHVLDKGVALVSLKDEVPFAGDHWHFQEMQKVYAKMIASKSARQKGRNPIGFDPLSVASLFVNHYPNFRCVTHFDAMPAFDEEVYLGLVKKVLVGVESDEVESVDLLSGGKRFVAWKNGLAKSVKWLYESGASTSQVSARVGLSEVSVRGLLKSQGVVLKVGKGRERRVFYNPNEGQKFF